MMNLFNCVICGKMFRDDVHVARRCPECQAENEGKLREIKELIVANPGMTVIEASELSGLPYRQIMEWIREGRIIR